VPAEKRRLLIVDDDPDLLLALRDRMEWFGFRVMTVSNARDAVEEVKRGGYALVMMDFKMPGMDGIEALRLIRQIQPRTPVIMMTSSEGAAIASLSEGAKAYVLKPFEWDSLKETVYRWSIPGA